MVYNIYNEIKLKMGCQLHLCKSVHVVIDMVAHFKRATLGHFLMHTTFYCFCSHIIGNFSREKVQVEGG